MHEELSGELSTAVEMAFHIARATSRSEGADAVPAPLRPLMGFSRLPEKARSVVQRVVEEHDEFRAVVVESVAEAEVGELAWVWLTRPDGWDDTLDVAAREAAVANDAAVARREVRELRRRLERVEAERDQAVSEASSAADTIARHRIEREQRDADLADAEAAADELRREVERLGQRAAELDKRATRAEANLGDARRRLRETDGGDNGQGSSRQPARDAAAARAAARLADAAGELRRVASTLESTAGDLAPESTGDDAPDPDGAERYVRRPHRSARGLADDSPDGLAALLELPDATLVVDGYNVAMLGWPTLDLADTRGQLMRGLDVVAAQCAADVEVVFDAAAADPGTPTSRTGASRLSVLFSPTGVIADDVIVARARELDPASVVIVVTDDRELLDRVRRLGCNTAGSRALLGLLDRGVPPRT